MKKIHDFNEYSDFIKSFEHDNEFSDPHYLHNPNNLFDSLNKKDQIVLATFKDTQINGIYVLLVLPSDKYVEVIIALSKNEGSYSELFSYLENKYSGYQIDFVINPNNFILKKMLQANNAAFEVEQIKMMHIEDKALCISNDVRLYTDEFRKQYLLKHSKNTYWVGEKVLEAQDQFRVLLAIENNKVIGYLDITYCFEENEPYDLYEDDGYFNNVKRDLLIKAIELNPNKKIMVLVDADDRETVELYKSVGFAVVRNQNSLTIHWETTG